MPLAGRRAQDGRDGEPESGLRQRPPPGRRPLSSGRRRAGAGRRSARLRADQLPENPNAAGVRAYFGDDVSRDEQRSPVSFAGCNALPAFIVTAEFENPLLDLYGLEFAHRIALARRRAPRYLQMPGHNHISIMANFSSGEDSLGLAIPDFFGCAGPGLNFPTGTPKSPA